MQITENIKKLYQLKKAKMVLEEHKLMDVQLEAKIDKEVTKYGNLDKNK